MINKLSPNILNTFIENPVKNTIPNRKFNIATNNDGISFKGDISGIIVSSNPYNMKNIMLVSINNYSAKAKNFFTRAVTKVFKYLFTVAEPGAILKDSNAISFVITKGNTITGGLIGIKIPHRNNMKCLSLVTDSVNQDKKERIKSLVNLGKTLCEYCEKENIDTISWLSNQKAKSANNLYKKFSIVNNNEIYRYSASIDRLKEFLEEVRAKHPRIFK